MGSESVPEKKPFSNVFAKRMQEKHAELFNKNVGEGKFDYAALRIAKELADEVCQEVSKEIIDLDRHTRLLLAVIIAGGHVLAEGRPGVAKTTHMNAMARITDVDFNRIQGSPDLMPADIVGFTAIEKDGEGRLKSDLRRGPVFTNLLLADEINRNSPKVQSALLEAMQEKQVTIDGVTRPLSELFNVMAAMNPFDAEGTYDLPEAEKDRFMISMTYPFPSAEALRKIGKITTGTPTSLREQMNRVLEDKELDLSKVKAAHRESKLRQIIDSNDIMEMSTLVRRIGWTPEAFEAALKIVLRSQPDCDLPGKDKKIQDFMHKNVKSGASPRAFISLLMMSRAWAVVKKSREGEVVPPYADVEDVLEVVTEVMQHRIKLKPEVECGEDDEKITFDMIREQLVAGIDAHPKRAVKPEPVIVLPAANL
jgi:MoxR-like ATPase